ncbi:MAG: glycosyltransferase family 4 protein [Reyranella sp.]|uniref:glycosyltransferase family 4 protein n=1 Tax=Reyranella sp. TaxID=1929291 RepID=UPI003D0A7691
MAKRVTFAIPGDLETQTGGYAYDRRILSELQTLGWQVDLVGLGDGFPLPSEEQVAVATCRLLSASAQQPIVIDGLGFGALPEAAAVLQATRPVVALVHHPLACETGLTPGVAERLRASERAALAAAHWVIATSDATADLLVDQFGVSRERLRVIFPGTDPVPQAAGRGSGRLRLLSVGAIVPRKGFDVLIEALSALTDLDWQLTIAGDRDRDRGAVERLDALIAKHRLGDRIVSPGAVSPAHLAELYAGADVFVLASHFEGYGMAYAEAVAHGLPIIGTTGGAIPQTVPASASRLVPPGDVAALALALRDVLTNEPGRRALATGARAAAAALPTWARSGEAFACLLEGLA